MRNTRDTKLLFELSESGRRSHRLPACDVPERPVKELLPASALAAAPPALPELSEPQVVRHFANLSQLNMSVDTNFYPLGSCTMKYNPKRNERVARMPGFADVHPYQQEETLQGMLQLLYEMQDYLNEISGLDACSLQPAAGAHGELTALWVASAYFRDRGEKRTKVLTPDSAHGTNPASATMAGFETVTVKTLPSGTLDMDDFHRRLDDQIAVFMITNPNTVGIFEPKMREIADAVHKAGGLVYLDGANMNAILGIARPGDFGADMQHYNPHKTFSGPHGGGGPGAGPICVTEKLAPYLPTPIVVREEGSGFRVQGSDSDSFLNPEPRALNPQFRLDYNRPKSIGRVRAFFGNVGVLVRAYCYIRTHGPDGLKRVSENAVLNANYLLSRVKHFLPVPQGDRCMHEFVASANKLKAEKGISAMDLAKRLLDFGIHAPTVYFPLTVKESIMVEPTETESKETLDAFAETLFRITEEDADQLRSAPHTTPISRPDEVRGPPTETCLAGGMTRVAESSPHHCLIIDPPAPGAWNMAVDEALLIDAAENGSATLRFYQWNEPTLSLGYFQAYEERHQHTASSACNCVRRQTGGGAIVHDREITYSIVLPAGHPCARHPAELYAKVHDAFIQSLTDRAQGAIAGINLQRLREVSNSATALEPFLCFQRRAIGDVVAIPKRRSEVGVTDSDCKDYKILGSAQRRSRGALLQHGSLLLQQSTAAPELIGFYDLPGGDSPEINPERLIPRLEAALDVRFTAGNLSQNVELNARQLANNKYGTAAWTKRR